MNPRIQVPPRDLIQLPWRLPETRNVAKHKKRVWRTQSVFTLQDLGLSEVPQFLGMIAVPLLGGTTAFISYLLLLKRKTSKCIYYLGKCVDTGDEGRHGLGKSFGCRCCISATAPRPCSAIPAASTEHWPFTDLHGSWWYSFQKQKIICDSPFISPRTQKSD